MSKLTKLYHSDNAKFGNKLFHSCRNGDLDFVQEFVNLDIALSYCSMSTISQMFEECSKNGHLDIIKTIYNSPYLKELTKKSFHITRSFNHACAFGHLDIVKYLAEEAPGERESRYNPWDGVSAAIKNGYLDIVKYCIDTNLKPWFSERRRGDMIHAAAKDGQLEIMKYLFDVQKKNGGNIDEYLHMNNDMAFREAYNFKHLNILKFFIFDLNIRLNSNIIQTIAESPNKDVSYLLELRELNKNLTSGLVQNEKQSRKPKI